MIHRLKKLFKKFWKWLKGHKEHIEIKIEVQAIKEIGAVKCPRCYRYDTVVDNFDYLCDRCCDALLEDFKDDPRPDFQELLENIRKNKANQRLKYSGSSLKRLEYIQKVDKALEYSAKRLKCPQDQVPQRIEAAIKRLEELEKERDELNKKFENANQNLI